MLHPHYAAALWKQRLIGLGLLAVVGSLARFVLGSMSTASGIVWLVGAFTVLLLGFVAVWALPIVGARPAPTCVILDRRVRCPREDTSWERADAGRRAITQRWQEVDEVAITLGVEPLAGVLSTKIQPGCARHDPERGLRTVDALLSAPAIAGDERLVDGLRWIRRELEAAQQQGARFCLMPTSVWSGQADSIVLFLGTSDA